MVDFERASCRPVAGSSRVRPKTGSIPPWGQFRFQADLDHRGTGKNQGTVRPVDVRAQPVDDDVAPARALHPELQWAAGEDTDVEFMKVRLANVILDHRGDRKLRIALRDCAQ